MSSEELYKIPGERISNGILLPAAMAEENIRRIADADLRGDVVVTGYSKTGSTWLTHLLWLLMNDADTETAMKIPLYRRCRLMELMIPTEPKSNLDAILEQPHPRVMLSHLRPRFLSEHLDGPTKFVVIVRNPKDTLVSFYHFYQTNAILGQYKGTWDEFFKLVQTKHVVYGDFFDWYMDWLQYRDRENFLFISYEEMRTDLKAALKKLADFIQIPLDDSKCTKIAEASTFDAMKKVEDMPDFLKKTFFRKGKVGGWKDYFSPEQNDYIDNRYKETLEKAGLVINFS